MPSGSAPMLHYKSCCCTGRLAAYCCLSISFTIVRERDNAGLNVTCASRVFLVESVVNHGFEVQGWFVSGLNMRTISLIHRAAIARIDRMGQTKPTEGASGTG